MKKAPDQTPITNMHNLHDILPKLSPKDVILDVRTSEEYHEDGHIEGSLNIPHTELQKRFEELKKYDRIYIHCKMGGRAKTATLTLESLGFKNLECISENGMVAWLEAGYPVSHD